MFKQEKMQKNLEAIVENLEESLIMVNGTSIEYINNQFVALLDQMFTLQTDAVAINTKQYLDNLLGKKDFKDEGFLKQIMQFFKGPGLKVDSYE